MANSSRIDLGMQLLRAAVETNPTGKAGVSKALGRGFGRAYLSRVLSPNDAKTMSAALADRVIEIYAVVQSCPATSAAIQQSECRRINTGGIPTHNPATLRIWKVCQTCTARPKKES